MKRRWTEGSSLLPKEQAEATRALETVAGLGREAIRARPSCQAQERQDEPPKAPERAKIVPLYLEDPAERRAEWDRYSIIMANNYRYCSGFAPPGGRPSRPRLRLPRTCCRPGGCQGRVPEADAMAPAARPGSRRRNRGRRSGHRARGPGRGSGGGRGRRPWCRARASPRACGGTGGAGSGRRSGPPAPLSPRTPARRRAGGRHAGVPGWPRAPYSSRRSDAPAHRGP